MIFITFFITYLTFPSLILYNELPFLKAHDKENDWTQKLYTAALLGLVNVGMCYMGSALGTLMANCYKFKMSGWTCIFFVTLELVFTGMILASVLTTKELDQVW